MEFTSALKLNGKCELEEIGIKFSSRLFYICGAISLTLTLSLGNSELSNNINSQPDATITNFIDNYNQLNMFREIISPNLRSTGLWLQLVVYSTDDVTSRQHRRCIIPQAVNTA